MSYPYPDTKRLEVAKRSLTFLDSDFSRLPQQGDRQGLQRALGKLTHARAHADLHRRVLEDAHVGPDDGKPLRAMAASLLAAAEPGAKAWLHHTPCHKVPSLTPSEFRTATRLTLCLDLPEIAQAVREETPCSCCGERFMTPALFAAHALCSKHRRPDGGGSVYAMHNCVAHTIQEFARHAGVASFFGGGMCRAGTGPDGHPIHADIAFTGLKAGAAVGSLELGDVDGATAGGRLNIMQLRRRPGGVINAGIADKARSTQSPSRTER